MPDESYRAARAMIAATNGDSGPGPPTGSASRCAVCPRIPRDFPDDERRSLGDLWFRQEYCCEFIDNETQLFSRDIIQCSVDKDIELLF